MSHAPHSSQVIKRASRIRILFMDCDGVLTNGSISLDARGDEIKHFHVHDGQGFSLARAAGLQTAIITGRSSSALERRVSEHGCNFLIQGSQDKLADFLRILDEVGSSPEEAAYIGDDLPDLPPMRRSGLAIAVANAVEEVKNRAHLITKKSGGCGAVRESIELILKARSLWESVLARYDI